MKTSQSPPPGGPDRPRLSEAQKKENHIRSEQKRREAIRDGFDRLASIVPGMEGQGRSEAVVLEATLQHMRDKIDERQQLIAQAKAKGLDTGAWELSRETVHASDTQQLRNEGEQQRNDEQQSSN